MFRNAIVGAFLSAFVNLGAGTSYAEPTANMVDMVKTVNTVSGWVYAPGDTIRCICRGH